MERVSVIEGKSPVIFVCPHGGDIPMMAQFTEETTYLAEANAVINRGFMRGLKLNYKTETADCNRLDHILAEQVVFDEFLKPLIKIKDDLKEQHKRIYMYILTDLLPAGPKELDILIGYGNRSAATMTCPAWTIELLATSLRHFQVNPFEARETGPNTASNPSCLNQAFRTWNVDKNVLSMQLSVNNHAIKKSKASAIADSTIEVCKHVSYKKILRLPTY